jgi:predicted ATP-dependent protease
MRDQVLTAHLKLEIEALSPAIDLEAIHESLKVDAHEPINFIGQKRARAALAFGLGIESLGYNVYVMGESALGRHSLIDEHLKSVAKLKGTPDEWCYINNFDDNRVPRAIRLKPGESKVFCDDISKLIDELVDTFPAAFDHPTFQRRKKAIDRAFNIKYDDALEKVESEALRQKVALFEENGAVTFSPVVNDAPLDDTEFAKLSEDERAHFYDIIGELEVFLNERLVELPQWKREVSVQLRDLKKETIENALRPLLKALEHKYKIELGILKYLKDMRKELVNYIHEWLSDEESESKEELDKRAIFEDLIQPNPLVHYKTDDGAPTIYEANPTYQNMFGKIEYSSMQGSLFTNFSMVRAGALHKANGGYLLVDANKLMSQPYVWDALKLAIKTCKINIETPAQEIGMVNSVSLTPHQIPLNVKVVLMGSRELYYMMQEYDDEFNEYFRVLADFEYTISATDRTLYEFIQKVLTHVDGLDIDGISADAIARLLEFSYRQAEHQHKLSARFAHVLELIQEAIYYCEQDGESVISAEQINEALAGHKYRSGRISESFLEDLKEGQILIDTEGESIGKLNGLTVLEIGDTVFGTPARISSTVYAGANGVVDIEREVELGKSIHSKGVMLLTGYLGHKYAQEFCLTLSANIALEQSYGHIDGDSASLGEVCTLISAIARLPLKQSLAITGSINQHGQVQSIGGVNEKIEGFFELCKARKLTGDQGVIIPQTNAINLVLSQEVINACKRGQFSVYCLDMVDDALEILTGLKAGTLSKRGTYPKNSVNFKAVQRLKAIAEIVAGSEGD